MVGWGGGGAFPNKKLQEVTSLEVFFGLLLLAFDISPCQWNGFSKSPV